MSGNRGFTLIEVLLTITVVSVLLMIGMPQFIDFASDARLAVTRERMSAIREAILGDPRLVSGGVYTKPGYLGNCMRAPPSGNLDYLATDPGDPAECATPYDPITRIGWNGPYIDTSVTDWKLDAWGNGFEYTMDCGGDAVCGNSDDIRTLTSYGFDGASGGGDDITITF